MPTGQVTRTWQSQTDKSTEHLRTQFPLVLSWAMTVHKAQTQTLDSVCLDIGDKEYSVGQTFVALPRLTTLQSMAVRSFAKNRVHKVYDHSSHAAVDKQYERLKELSLVAEATQKK